MKLVQVGPPYVMFGDGQLSRADEISEADLARVMADCISDASKHGEILPVGGPGNALTPLQQSEILFDLFGPMPTAIAARRLAHAWRARAARHGAPVLARGCASRRAGTSRCRSR